MSSFDNPGKFRHEFFDKHLFPLFGKNREAVKQGPAFGVDVSVVDLGYGQGMALTSDPLSLIPSLGLRESAWLSVQLLVNDMATTGFPPMFAQFVLNLPVSMEEDAFAEYWQWMHKYCEEAGVAITGGHTCKVEGQNSTISGGGTMMLTAPLNEILTSAGAASGDALVLIGEPALSSSAILSLSFPETLKNHLGIETQQAGAAKFFQTSVLAAALAASAFNKVESASVKAMHDVTEGGIMGAAYEMGQASRCGVTVLPDAIPGAPVQEAICGFFGIHPHYCIGAGALVVAVNKTSEKPFLEHIRKQGFQAATIGFFNGVPDQSFLETSRGKTPFFYPEEDPYWNAFYTAIQKGLT